MNEKQKALAKTSMVEFNKIFDLIKKSVLDTTENLDKKSEQVFYFTGFITLLIDQLIDLQLQVIKSSVDDKSLSLMILKQLDEKIQEKIKESREDCHKCAV
ncbi:hypothetical protein Psal071_03548 (plasmid) [Piscirickettsia salmonis]|uniref:Uncharacterized protein n=1 Tax=Piscirickettsia salmonis TaxID=1238 RepID=A0A9Q6PUC0_PISSA|nr:hypothetical protein [Piscirickettsia salmonis]QGN96949.1 hypothetical protein Psal006a_03604 [Piscirickettsia salmonis]QGO07722.1 hypothetical protein Psal009_03681 [Piscirickettsia salmonis]QGO36182.1 hypothetical protein Psal028_03569 [Piscirickettsia salmonis]QGO39807.1 hypothetical protein Psal040_03584 [Piscirickettsia salmonis]QGO43369.1 hypothetical protein Psal041_03520 [Piscirickettsia salmonis]